MEFLIKQLGRIKKFPTFIIALIFIISISWLADGFVEFLKLLYEGNLNFVLISAVIITLNLILYWLIGKLSKIKENHLFLAILTCAFVVLLFAFALREFLKENLLAFIQFSLSSITFLIIWLYIRNSDLRFSVKEVSPKNIKGLVMFLSHWTNIPQNFNACNFKDLQGFYNCLKCPWEMQIRILDEYKEIKYLYVIASENGSYSQIEIFKQLVKKFFPNLEIIVHREPIDFENLEENILALEEAFKTLKEKPLKDNEILIDTTGGQKVQGIAGAFYSLNYDRYFVYVSTNSKKVKVFDVIIRETEGG